MHSRERRFRWCGFSERYRWSTGYVTWSDADCWMHLKSPRPWRDNVNCRRPRSKVSNELPHPAASGAEYSNKGANHELHETASSSTRRGSACDQAASSSGQADSIEHRFADLQDRESGL